MTNTSDNFVILTLPN